MIQEWCGGWKSHEAHEWVDPEVLPETAWDADPLTTITIPRTAYKACPGSIYGRPRRDPKT